jgi:hypothetical protein
MGSRRVFSKFFPPMAKRNLVDLIPDPKGRSREVAFVGN